jgi:hypothetical protein
MTCQRRLPSATVLQIDAPIIDDVRRDICPSIEAGGRP